ncbi:MAG: XdhC family protein [Desulfobacteraceae bacterium]|nr:XdhC family protein [Desulfobacteraceae bacterium]
MESLTPNILNCLNQGIPFALATIITHKGSTPRTSGSKMLVLFDGQLYGTIGGGLVEAKIIEACQTMIPTPGCQIKEFILNQELSHGLDMVCGGNLTIWIETFGPKPSPELIQVFTAMAIQEKEGKKNLLISRIQGFSNSSFTTQKYLVLADGTTIGPNLLPKTLFDAIDNNLFSNTAPVIQNHNLEEFIIEPGQTNATLYIFGAGHVGLQLAKMAHLTDFRTIIVDDRAEFANEKRFKHAHTVHVAEQFPTAFDELIHKKLVIDKNCYIVILTRGHLHDQTVLEAALKTKAGYIGMIGSTKKRDQIYGNLRKKGISKKNLNRVYSPIGLDINSETPAEIAVSIIGQIIQIRAQTQ